LVERTSKGIRIIDLKSSLAEPSTKIQPAHRVQLLLYCALYKGVYGELPYEMEIRHFDGSRLVEGVDSSEVDNTVAQVLAARDSVNAAGRQTQQELWWWLARADPQVCRHCNYQPVCRPFFRDVASELPPYAASVVGTVVERFGVGDLVRIRVECPPCSPDSAMRDAAPHLISVLGIPSTLAPEVGNKISLCWAIRSSVGGDLRVNWLSVLHIWTDDQPMDLLKA
jgi:hypothetical protein